MRLPRIAGVIRRRILVNYRIDPAVMAPLLPAPFRPQLQAGYAIAGICLIRLERIRPAGLPGWLGIQSENAAHRVAVTWTDDDGAQREGVYIPRRDSSSLLNHLVGGRLFPGEHHRAAFDVRDQDGAIELTMRSSDGSVAIDLQAGTASDLPAGSRFGSLADVSAFFERGSLGYSATASGTRLDGVELVTRDWRVEPLAVTSVRSSWFDDPTRFPAGSIELDCALVMRNLDHEWRSAPDLATGGACCAVTPHIAS